MGDHAAVGFDSGEFFFLPEEENSTTGKNSEHAKSNRCSCRIVAENTPDERNATHGHECSAQCLNAVSKDGTKAVDVASRPFNGDENQHSDDDEEHHSDEHAHVQKERCKRENTVGEWHEKKSVVEKTASEYEAFAVRARKNPCRFLFVML